MKEETARKGSLGWLKVAVVILGLVVAVLVFLSWKSTAELHDTSSAASDSIADLKLSQETTAPEPIEGEGMIDQSEGEPKKSGQPKASDMPFARSVRGNSLTVIIPGFESLGEVSVERYDGDGKPTGEPLARGTQVQIPDPNRSGEKIYFRVP